MSENTAQQTHDFTRFETINHHHDLQNLNRNGDLLSKNQKKKKLESLLRHSPLEELELLFRIHGIEAAVKVGENVHFEEETNLLQETNGKNRILTLPENGIHEDTPYNMHLTGHNFSSNSDGIWRTPLLHRQEESVNAGHRINREFLSQYNLNPLDRMLYGALPSDQPTPFGHNMTMNNSNGSRPNFNLTTADYGNGANTSTLLNMNDVFEAFPDDE